MEQDKLTSMKQVMKYQELVEKFPAEQAHLLQEIEKTKTANALVEAALRGIQADKKHVMEM